MKKVSLFYKELVKAGLQDTYEAEMARVSLELLIARRERQMMRKAGTLVAAKLTPMIRPCNEDAVDGIYFESARKIAGGLVDRLAGRSLWKETPDPGIVKLANKVKLFPPVPADRSNKETIRLHEDNPRYLFWRGKPTVLITSGEHYGAVMNAQFDYLEYLDELQSEGLNLTRIFSGVYCEAIDDFDIENNTLAPERGNLLCPFARSDTPGYANGGNKFDLSKFDDAYFERLKDFVAQAGKRGIVVEYTFFCPYYHPSQWSLTPLNPKNNINRIDVEGGMTKAFGPFGHAVLAHPKLLSIQQALIQKVVRELNDADNLYYEICNEAYSVNRDWQHSIAETIFETEKDLPYKHLIAQNVRSIYTAVHPAVAIYNFHPGATNTSVRENYGLKKLIGLDETSPSGKPRGTDQRPFDYRRWAWTHLLDGGAIYNNLDHSFTVEDPKGHDSWGQDSKMAKVRKQLGILKDFVEGVDFVHMKPVATHVSWSGSVGSVHVLAKHGQEYAIYLYGLYGAKSAKLTFDLPAGRYRAEWVNTRSGNVDKAEDVSHDGGPLTLRSPAYKDDVALRLKKV